MDGKKVQYLVIYNTSVKHSFSTFSSQVIKASLAVGQNSTEMNYVLEGIHSFPFPVHIKVNPQAFSVLISRLCRQLSTSIPPSVFFILLTFVFASEDNPSDMILQHALLSPEIFGLSLWILLNHHSSTGILERKANPLQNMVKWPLCVVFNLMQIVFKLLHYLWCRKTSLNYSQSVLHSRSSLVEKSSCSHVENENFSRSFLKPLHIFLFTGFITDHCCSLSDFT